MATVYEYNPMVTSVDDLKSRLTDGVARNISSGTDPMQSYHFLGLPLPVGITDQQITKMEPFFLELLNHIEEGDELIRRMDSSEDEAVMLLQTFAVPLNVNKAKTNDVGRRRGPGRFEMSDIASRMIANEALLTWCRTAITEQQSHPSRTLVSTAGSILYGMTFIPNEGMDVPRVQERIRKVIFLGRSDEEGLDLLRHDLLGMAWRDDADPELVILTIVLQQKLMTLLYGERTACARMMIPNPQTVGFGKALERFKDYIPLPIYESLRLGIGYGTEQEYLYAQDQIHAGQPLNMPFQKGIANFLCGRKGCKNTSEQRCSRCKTEGYCSRDCQAAAWKVHKKSCKPFVPSNDDNEGVNK